MLLINSMKRLDGKIFINRANIKHNNRYDYSKVVYKNSSSKVKIICSEHGEFEQEANSHLLGKGCGECSGNIKKTNNKFINDSKIIHNNKYDYSKVVYKNNKTKIKIICSKHEQYKQTPDSHLRGCGCPKCGNDIVAKKNLKSIEQFVKEAKLIHDNAYDYSRVVYKNTDIKVEIICPKHGMFEQKPTKHLQNQGCPICRESKLEKEVRYALVKNNIYFEAQYGRVNDELFLSGQTIDFYLSEYNLGIECQGAQHFSPVDFGNKGKKYAVKKFNKLIIMDNKKYMNCKNKGVEILYYINNNDYFSNSYIGEMFCSTLDLIKKIKNNE